MRVSFTAVFSVIILTGFAQKPKQNFGGLIPCSAKDTADKYLLKYLPKSLFDSCIVFDTSNCIVSKISYVKGDTLIDYSLAYRFCVPGIRRRNTVLPYRCRTEK